jgi:hypothetical protein
MEIYLKAAEEGYAAAQFIVGLAFLDGYGVEKNGHSAYYWLRMAEENSSAVRQRSRALTEDLRTKINPGEIEDLERSIAIGARNDKILASKPVELFKQCLPLLTDRQAVSLRANISETPAVVLINEQGEEEKRRYEGEVFWCWVSGGRGWRGTKRRRA